MNRDQHRRILSPGAGIIYDADAQLLFDRMTTAPDVTRKGLINDMILGLKADGDWTRLDVLVVLAAADSQAALLDWKDLSDGAEVSAPTFETDRGYTSDGSTSYINSQFNPSTDAVKYIQNNASYGVYGRDNKNETGILAGLIISNFNGSFYFPRLSNNFSGRINSNNSLVLANTDSRGLSSVQRQNSTLKRSRMNGVNLGSNTDNSVSPANGEFYILCRNKLGTGAETFSTIQGALYFFGSGLLNHLNVYNRIQTYMIGVGANV